MSVRKLDFSSILGRIALNARQTDAGANPVAIDSRDIMAGWKPGGSVRQDAEELADLAAARARAQYLIPRDCINATGIMIHTGWGNAPLSAQARARLLESTGSTPTGAAITESRTAICDRMLRALTGAERATVTTLNAAPVLLAAGALAAGKDVVVAARDLIEISEGVRIGDIIEASGARI